MNINDFKRGTVHFIGCGGAGMAPLAAILIEKGFKVSGSDLKGNGKTAFLIKHGLVFSEGHQAGNITPETSLVIYSSAVNASNVEFSEAQKRRISMLRRGELLALIATQYRRVVAIAGSHGKTTVTAMLVHILTEWTVDCGFLIGGELCSGRFPAAAGDGDIFVTEVDESDGTNALIKADIGIITNVEDDHAWSVGGNAALFDNFKTFAASSRQLITVKDQCPGEISATSESCSLIDPRDLEFTALKTDALANWGGYQKINAALAVEAAVALGMHRGAAQKALAGFDGVARRMTLHYKSKDLTVIEDYAHHPTEVRAAISTLRQQYPDSHLRVVFQPHRYARLERYFDEFAAELRNADSVLITPVFAAWTESGPVDSAALAQAVGPKAEYTEDSWQDVARQAFAFEQRPLLVGILGAGDINKIFRHLRPYTGFRVRADR